ncbi:MAG TPA: hypothetical protein QGF35_01665 [Dehalococcoidia bacterium]|nr:hypothetical protein [Dehalococcoidia bacterium]
MWHFLRRQLAYFLIGFVVTFVIYLFVRFDADKILLGIAVGAIGGAAVMAIFFWLERQFPEDSDSDSDG